MNNVIDFLAYKAKRDAEFDAQMEEELYREDVLFQQSMKDILFGNLGDDMTITFTTVDDNTNDYGE